VGAIEVTAGNESQPGGARLELRILTGRHAGARAPVSSTGAPLSVSRTLEADIVLRDPDMDLSRATVCAKSDGWIWLATSDAEPLAMQFGRPARAGPVLLTVEASNAPWPNAASLAESAISHPPEDQSSIVVDALESQEHAAATAMFKRAAAQLRRFCRVGLLLLALIGAILLGVKMVSWIAPVAHPVPVATTRPVVADAALVRKLLGEAGWDDTVRVVSGAGSSVQAIGVVDTDETLQELVARFARLSPRPSLRVVTQADFIAAIRELAATLEPGLSLTPLPRGRVRLEGLVRTRDATSATVQRIERELPLAAAPQVSVVLAEDVVAAFSAELSRHGLGQTKATWTGEQMRIEGKLAADQISVWERLILGFHARYGVSIPFVAKFENGPVTDSRSVIAVARRPTFAASIVAVIGGENGYVLLSNGSKLMPGGTMDGYRLETISTESLLFEAPNRLKVEVPR
jgi:type III secretion system YscD/HrpQ family protein